MLGMNRNTLWPLSSCSCFFAARLVRSGPNTFNHFLPPLSLRNQTSLPYLLAVLWLRSFPWDTLCTICYFLSLSAGESTLHFPSKLNGTLKPYKGHSTSFTFFISLLKEFLKRCSGFPSFWAPLENCNNFGPLVYQWPIIVMQNTAQT